MILQCVDPIFPSLFEIPDLHNLVICRPIGWVARKDNYMLNDFCSSRKSFGYLSKICPIEFLGSQNPNSFIFFGFYCVGFFYVLWYQSLCHSCHSLAPLLTVASTFAFWFLATTTSPPAMSLEHCALYKGLPASCLLSAHFLITFFLFCLPLARHHLQTSLITLSL